MFIENWKEAWKFFSVLLMGLIAIIAGLEPYVPQLEMILPDKWVAYVMPIVIIARLIKQKNLEVSDE